LCKKLIIILVFTKTPIFSSESWQKSQNIAIITSTWHEHDNTFSIFCQNVPYILHMTT
jgi:hypothetical protein